MDAAGRTAALRERVAAMQLRAYELQEPAGEPREVLDPLEEPTARARLPVPALVAAGQHGLPDFRDGLQAFAEPLAFAGHAVIAGAG